MTAATAKLAAMTTKNPAAAHPSPGFGGSEAEAGEMSPAASSAAKQANTSAHGGHADAGAEGDPGLRERPVASLLAADQQATSSPLASLRWEARQPVS